MRRVGVRPSSLPPGFVEIGLGLSPALAGALFEQGFPVQPVVDDSVAQAGWGFHRPHALDHVFGMVRPALGAERSFVGAADEQDLADVPVIGVDRIQQPFSNALTAGCGSALHKVIRLVLAPAESATLQPPEMLPEGRNCNASGQPIDHFGALRLTYRDPQVAHLRLQATLRPVLAADRALTLTDKSIILRNCICQQIRPRACGERRFAFKDLH